MKKGNIVCTIAIIIFAISLVIACSTLNSYLSAVIIFISLIVSLILIDYGCEINDNEKKK